MYAILPPGPLALGSMIFAHAPKYLATSWVLTTDCCSGVSKNCAVLTASIQSRIDQVFYAHSITNRPVSQAMLAISSGIVSGDFGSLTWMPYVRHVHQDRQPMMSSKGNGPAPESGAGPFSKRVVNPVCR